MNHTYYSAGNFTVTLTVGDGTGQTSSKSSIITATNATQTGVAGEFFGQRRTSGQGAVGQCNSRITSTGNPTAWNWNFGDGATSATQSPNHTYNSAGNFTVTLTVGDSSGADQQQESSDRSPCNQCDADGRSPPSFSANPSSGQAPLTVQFTDRVQQACD